MAALRILKGQDSLMFMRRKELSLLWKMEDVKSMIGQLISNGYLVMDTCCFVHYCKRDTGKGFNYLDVRRPGGQSVSQDFIQSEGYRVKRKGLSYKDVRRPFIVFQRVGWHSYI